MRPVSRTAPKEVRQPARGPVSPSGRRRVRIGLELLESRIVLSTSTYTWTGLGDGTTWSNAGNWSPAPPGNAGPTSGAAVVLPAIDTLPKGPGGKANPTTGTINVVGADVGAMTVDDSYTLQAAPGSKGATLTLDDRASITTGVGDILAFAPGLTVNTPGSVFEGGAGTVLYGESPGSISQQSISYDLTLPQTGEFLSGLLTLEPPGGEIELGNDFQQQLSSLNGKGSVRLNYSSTLTLDPPSGEHDQFSGSVSGGSSGSGTLDMYGAGSVTIRNFNGGGLYVASGAVLISGSAAFNSYGLRVESGATFGGSGAVSVYEPYFAAGSTYAVELDAPPASAPSAYLNMLDGASLGGTLSIAIGPGYSPQVGDTFTLVSAGYYSDIYGEFANASDGVILVFDKVPFQIQYHPPTADAGGSVTATVVDAATTTTVAPAPGTSTSSAYGQAVTFDATVAVPGSGSGNATGTVTFYDGDPSAGGKAIGSAQPLSNGKASLTTSALAVASHQIYAVYQPTGFFQSSTSSSLTQKVQAAGTTTTVTLDSSSANPSPYGQSVTFDAAVAAVAPGSGTPTGTVIFYDGNPTSGGLPIGTPQTLSGGKARVSTATLAAGSHKIYAVYQATTDFGGSTSAADTQAVQAAGTSTVVTLDPRSISPSAYGQSVTFDATVSAGGTASGTPTGTVTFYDGNPTAGGIAIGSPRTLSGGKASVTISTLGAATHRIYAVYQASTDFAGSTSAALTHSVQPASTATSLVLDASSVDPSSFGAAVTLDARVVVIGNGSGTPAGTLTFYDGNPASGGTAIGNPQALSGGKASIKTTALGAGPHKIYAVYQGSTDFATSTSTALLQTVDGLTTSTALVLGPGSSDPSSFGQPVTLVATVAVGGGQSGTLGGSVTFYDGDPNAGGAAIGPPVPLAGGKASLTTSALGVAGSPHRIYAVYGGAGPFNPSTSSPLVQAVTAAPTNVVVRSTVAGPMTAGQAVTFVATVTVGGGGAGTPAGSVAFYDGDPAAGGVEIGVPRALAGGVASIRTSSLSVGTHAIYASYQGGGNFAMSTSASYGQVIRSAAPGDVPTTTTYATSMTLEMVAKKVRRKGRVYVLEAIVTASGSGASPAGTVVFRRGGATIGGAALQAGIAMIPIGRARPRNKAFSATFAGGSDFAGSTASGRF